MIVEMILQLLYLKVYQSTLAFTRNARKESLHCEEFDDIGIRG